MAGASSSSSQQVSDMRVMYYEDCDEIQETETLSGVVRRQSKYGSTSSSSHMNHSQKFITHVVQPHDTLPGLALKYSVTMEQIRRANRMYTSDSLFCKSVLSIPVPVPVQSSPVSPLRYDDHVPESVVVHSDHPATSHPLTDKQQEKGQHLQQTHSHPHHHKDHSHKQNRKEQTPEISCSPESIYLQMDDPCSISLMKMNGTDPPATGRKKKVIITENAAKIMPEETANDFLHRIDSSIAKTRDQVEKKVSASGVSYSYSENDLFSLNQPGTSAASVSRSRSARFKPSANNSAVPNGSSPELPACYIRTADNKVRYSMRKLEQEQDELFQL